MMNKAIEYYLELPYTIELIRDAEDGWFVRVKELPGCMSQGDTAEEALAMIQEAMGLWLETALEDGVAIPEPRPADEYSGKFVVRLPRSLHRDLAEQAAGEGVSLNQLVVAALAQAVGRAQAAVPAPSESEAAPDRQVAAEEWTGYWPGLSSGARRALLAAGMEDEAGKLDEQMFGQWFEQQFMQVESVLSGDHGRREALPYLEALLANLYTAATLSPALAALRRTVDMLHQEVIAHTELQQKGYTGQLWQDKLAHLFRETEESERERGTVERSQTESRPRFDARRDRPR